MRYAVGEGAPFGFTACAGACDLAREDAERSEWLARRAREVTRGERDEPLPCRDCGVTLPENARGERCHSCRGKYERMRKTKQRKTVECWVCGAVLLKWGPEGKASRPRKVCDGCIPEAARRGSEASVAGTVVKEAE